MREEEKKLRGPTIALWAFLAAANLPVRADNPPGFEIAAQDAASALNEFSDQSRLQLLFDYDAVQGLRTRPVSGQLRVSDALTLMLSGTGLTFEIINDRTISILRDPEVLDGAMVAQVEPPKPVRREAV